MKYDVYGIGNALVDIEFKITDHFLRTQGIEKGLMTLVDEERQAELLGSLVSIEANKSCGGSAANTAIAVSQLGGKCFYSCKVADDEFGRFYLDDMLSNEVPTNNDSHSLPQGTTGKCMVFVSPDGERSMNTYLGITQTFSAENLDLDALAESRWLYIEGYLVASETGMAAALEAIEFARKNNIKIAITLSDLNMVTYFRDNFLKLINETPIDLLFANTVEAIGFTDSGTLEDSFEELKAYAKTFVVTQGGKGASYWNGHEIVHQDAVEVTPKDTNGAGDLFAGTFLYGVVNDLDDELKLKTAIRACSQLIMQYGARLTKKQLVQIKSEVGVK